jgi:hypothetical protein
VRRSLLLIPVLGVLAIAAVAFSLRPTSTAAASPTTAIRACVAAHGNDTKQRPETVDCLTGALVEAVRSGRYAEVLALRLELEGTAANSSCHAAGHAAGKVLVEEFGALVTLERMFAGPEEKPEYTCTAALVHGLVAGSASGTNPLSVEKIAEQCVWLGGINQRYQSECAHFFGHVVWDEVGELGDGLAERCKLVGVAKGWNPQRTCISGAIMQKFDLQAKHYDPENTEGRTKRPPTREELQSLCNVFASSDQETREGCFGALGWLAAVSTNDVLSYDSTEPGWDDKAMVVYLEAVTLCDGNEECHRNFVNHLRVNTFASGLAEKFCVQARVDMTTCRGIIDRYTKQN